MILLPRFHIAAGGSLRDSRCVLGFAARHDARLVFVLFAVRSLGGKPMARSYSSTFSSSFFLLLGLLIFCMSCSAFLVYDNCHVQLSRVASILS
ncbi:hypothetical protein SODALDRAFT_108614 [Sodiomyces alkalinus F11]|uniref:Uncharacterized protein n=1 Tax=Sodiomyces alkalinus (strain CBS 110278 / VKM F-3762 / F11) TaxID=1314773 RepID=A0A3N2Q2K8_SODAK|nr:hypothetical protein SODALDRAFT_108614 [Sodiomyces alkalinus F11]ROT40962.1 hypothetical protein SODALDRAFT_108614 [Sodiomyces alkalinus F11]